MAERIADGAEPAVDELRRKARRRLVGAIVLALAAAIIVPMLLENEPRPLGDDVSVQIPSKDEGRFVNRLTGTTPDVKPAPRAEAGAEAGAAGTVSKPIEPAPAASPAGTSRAAGAVSPAGSKKAIAEAEQRVLATAPSATAAPSATPMPTTPPVPTATTAPSATTAPTAPTAATASTTTPAPAAASVSPAEGFVVQLAAFADDKGANALANKLKRANYAAFVEPVATSRGTLWRVRVGGYASRAEADAARARLKDEGYSGIVAAVK